MRFETFERIARQEWDRIPEGYRAGVDGLVVERAARRHPRTHDIYTLGECVTEAYPSDFGGPDTIRSSVVLYYGSFLRLSRLDPAFDWERELWETLTHELKHHLESLADEDALTDVDTAMEEYFKRVEGEPFDPFFYRLGEPAGPDRYRLEDRLFIEQRRGAEPAVRFELDGRAYRFAASDPDADVEFVQIVGGIDEDTDLEELCVVLVRPLPLRRRLGMLFGRAPTIVESEATVEAEPGD